MELIRTTVKGNKEPDFKEVFWLDSKDEILKHYKNGKWVPVIAVDPNAVRADNEDTTSVKNDDGINVLKLADKKYLPEKYSGLGRIYLRKNMVKGRNILTQEMINTPNTIYHIQYDYDLNNTKINIPNNCILQFEGGSLSNGSLNGICRYDSCITLDKLFNNIDISNLNIIDINLFVINNSIWGITNDGTNSEATTKGLNNAFEFAYKLGYHKVKLEKGTYLVKIKDNKFNNGRFNESLTLYSDTEYDLNESTIQQEAHNQQSANTIFLWKLNNVTIKNGTIIGDRETHDYSSGGTHEGVCGIGIWSGQSIIINNIKITNCTGDCIGIAGTSSIGGFNPNDGAKNTLIQGCDLSHSRRQGISVMNAFDTIIDNCNIHDIGLTEENGTPPKSGIDLEPWNETFVAEIVLRTTIKNCTFDNNWRHIIIANGLVHDTIIDNCSFISPKLDTIPTYPSDITSGIADNYLNFPTVTESNQNKYPVDIYWTYGNTIIKNCNFRNCSIGDAFYVENCIFLGDYDAVSASSVKNENGAKTTIKNCYFYGKFLSSGKGNILFDNCYFNYIHYFNNTNIEAINCIFGITNCNVNIKKIHNCKINECHKTIGGYVYNSDITFAGMQHKDGTSYSSANYLNCTLTFNENVSLKVGGNYYLNILNSIININSAYSIVGSSKQAIINNNVININHENGTYTNKYFSSTSLIATNNVIINQIERTSQAATFGNTGVIKNNVYIGDNLINENQ